MTLDEKANEITTRIIADMTNRRGLRQEWDGIDDETKGEIIETWNAIAFDVLQST